MVVFADEPQKELIMMCPDYEHPVLIFRDEIQIDNSILSCGHWYPGTRRMKPGEKYPEPKEIDENGKIVEKKDK